MKYNPIMDERTMITPATTPAITPVHLHNNWMENTMTWSFRQV